MPTATETALAHFLYRVAAEATECADKITRGDAHPDAASLDDVYLGSAQRAMAELVGMRFDRGLSPREVCTLIGNDDEPNVRTSLNGMVKRGIMERVPGVTPQRFRLLARYRAN